MNSMQPRRMMTAQIVAPKMKSREGLDTKRIRTGRISTPIRGRDFLAGICLDSGVLGRHEKPSRPLGIDFRADSGGQ
jgi:hypothetical protein